MAHIPLPGSLLGTQDPSQTNSTRGRLSGQCTTSRVRSCVPVTVTPDLSNSYSGHLRGPVIRSEAEPFPGASCRIPPCLWPAGVRCCYDKEVGGTGSETIQPWEGMNAGRRPLQGSRVCLEKERLPKPDTTEQSLPAAPPAAWQRAERFRPFPSHGACGGEGEAAGRWGAVFGRTEPQQGQLSRLEAKEGKSVCRRAHLLASLVAC